MACLYNILVNNPFTAWGELLLIAVQCAIQCALFWSFSLTVHRPSRLIGSAVYVGICGYVLSGQLPSNVVPVIGSLPLGLSIWSRLPQIMMNFRQGHTGQLAFLTFFLSALGTIARVFTTLSKTPDDKISLLSNSVSAVLNSLLVAQILVYWTATNRALESKKAK